MEREEMNFDSVSVIVARANNELSKKLDEGKCVHQTDPSQTTTESQSPTIDSTSLSNKSISTEEQDSSSPSNISKPKTSPLLVGAKKKRSNIQFGVSTSPSSHLLLKKNPNQHRGSSALQHKQHGVLSSGISEAIWDHKEDHTIRHVVEEGKVNLLLRLLSEFKEEERMLSSGQRNLDDTVKLSELKDQNELKDKMKLFETNLGYILKFCFYSIEALQTLDVYQLFDHITTNMNPSQFEQLLTDETVYKRQEILVFDYLRSVYANLERIDESKVANITRERKIIPKAIKFLVQVCPQISEEERLHCFESLSAVMDSESYRSNAHKYYDDEETKRLLINLHDDFVKKLLVNYERKKALRALVDQCNRFKNEFLL